MTEKKISPAVEIVPYNRDLEHALELKQAMTQLIEEKVAEATGGPGAIFQPFFHTKRLATEIQRQQSVPEQNKFTYYYERWGCLAGCGRTKEEALHASLGMCGKCFQRIAQRLKALVREHTPEANQDESFVDAVTQARAALDPSMRMLALSKQQKRRYYTQVQAAEKAGVGKSSLSKWVRDGVIRPSIRFSPKTWMWTEADIEEIKLLKGKRVSLQRSTAVRARWSKKNGEPQP
jgi:hypothetical protein